MIEQRPGRFFSVPALVAIPVRDEVERIVDCLVALSMQATPPGVVLLVNNTTDATMERVASVAPSLRCPVLAIPHVFPMHEASAGQARRLAMAHADRLAPEGVPLLTTDADGRVAPDWLEANLYHLRRGLDAVFGVAEIDPVEAERIPATLIDADAAECAYGAALTEMACLVNPVPWDPWPRHAEHSGASIAVTRGAYRTVGGMPAPPLGEDRAFAERLRRAGMRVRHAPEVRVMVSGRILGRAAGGMADTIRRRLVAPDLFLDDAMEPAKDRLTRLQDRRFLGEAMTETPMQRVAVADLPRQLQAARAIIAALRAQLPGSPALGGFVEHDLERTIEQA